MLCRAFSSGSDDVGCCRGRAAVVGCAEGSCVGRERRPAALDYCGAGKEWAPRNDRYHGLVWSLSPKGAAWHIRAASVRAGFESVSLPVTLGKQSLTSASGSGPYEVAQPGGPAQPAGRDRPLRPQTWVPLGQPPLPPTAAPAPAPPLPSTATHALVPVFFATDRERVRGAVIDVRHRAQPFGETRARAIRRQYPAGRTCHRED